MIMRISPTSKKRLSALSILTILALAALSIGGSAPREVTFERDVVPILQKHCQSCHRPGEIGPMSLLSYKDVRPWAKAIRDAVLLREMPPWGADLKHGRFRNDRSMSQREIEMIVGWVDGGARQGDPKDAPPAREFASGWRIGQPDVIFEIPKDFHVPPTGTVPYQWIIVPTGFTEDKWVKAVEVRPGNPAVVHHAVVYAREPESNYARGYPRGEFFDYIPVLARKPRAKDRTMLTPVDEPNHLQAWAPGADPVVLGPGQARLIKAGSDIVFQMHYTTTGEPATDRTKIGLIFAREPIKERVKTLAVINGSNILIPPGEANYRMVSQVEVKEPVRIVYLFPHMHLRGKSFEYRVEYPNGESEVLLNVPRYRFHWQMSYYLEQPKLLPVGTILTCTAVYDNSADNPDNPDPSATVRGGLQSNDEMMSGHIDVGFSPGSENPDFFRDARPKMTPARSGSR
jgi:Copper type II ascorbate-dependent monooxygenase, C-terminal domain